MKFSAKKTEEKIARAREAAQARHEARQQQAAQRQVEQLAKRAAKRQAREQARQQAGQPGSPGGRPLLADEKLQLHTITVRLDSEQYRQLSTYSCPGGRTLAATVRQILAGRRVFTTEEQTLLRRAPDLANAATELARQQASLDPVRAAVWDALAARVDAFLTGLHY